MKTERLIGLTVFIGTLILILFLFYPSDNTEEEKGLPTKTETIIDSMPNILNKNLGGGSEGEPGPDNFAKSDVFKDKMKSNAKDEAANISSDEGFKVFNESDFDFFVYRAHVLSSRERAENLKNRINDGGYPSFVEEYGNGKDLFAIYVGPFLSEDDIVMNIKSIQLLSESDNGEIVRWKL